MRLIVNADDFGISDHVNVEIERGFTNGTITSATLLANAPETAAAALVARRFPDVSIGVHLNLTEFKALTIQDSSLLTSEGIFSPTSARGENASMNLVRLVRAEWRAQVERVLNLGVNISHVDGHQHIHTRPVYLLPLIMVLREFNIGAVRISRTVYLRQPPIWWRMSKRLYNTALKTAGLHTTNEFGALGDVLAMAAKDRFGRRDCIEAMVHPGHPGYEAENLLLRQSRQTIERYGFTLINYRQL